MTDPYEAAELDDEALHDLHMQWQNAQHQRWVDSLSDEDREDYERHLASWNDEP